MCTNTPFFPQAVNDWNAVSESGIQITDPAAFKDLISKETVHIIANISMHVEPDLKKNI